MSQAAAHAHGARMNIGEVLDRLRPDFPGVTIPKIRFLEDKGLIKPEPRPATASSPVPMSTGSATS